MFRLLLFFPLFVLANEVFTLPDHATHLINTLELRLKKANNEVYIFTPILNEYSLVKRLKQIAKKEIKIIIVTSKVDNIENKTKHLSLFNNISIFTLEALQNSEMKDQLGLKGSLVCIDNKEMFLLADALESKSLKSNYSFAYWQTGPCKEIFETLLKRTKAY